MIIKKYKKLKDNRYQVTIDDEIVTLYDDIIIKYNLLGSKEITERNLDQIKDDNNKTGCYYQAIKFYAVKLRTKKELDIYLTKKEFDKSCIIYALSRLESEGYFNHKIYLTSYINDQINLTNNGPHKIMSNLIKLGFNEDEVLKYLDFNDLRWVTKINKIITQKIKTNHKHSEFELKQKIMNDLIYLGFDREVISEQLNSVKLDDQAVFNKVANKIYDKLSKKYPSNKLEYYFRSKMFTLGYSNELTNEYLNNKKQTD